MPSSHPDIENATPPQHDTNPITKFKDWVTKSLIRKLRIIDVSPRWWGRAAAVLGAIFLTFLLFTIVFPIFIVSIVWTGKVDWLYSPDERRRRKQQQAKASGLSKKPADKSLLPVGSITATRIGILVLVWLPINLSVRTLREDARFLGTQLWKWSVIAAVILLLTPAILLLAYILTTYIRLGLRDAKIVYWIRGVEDNVRRVLYFSAILHVWVVYFAADYDEINKTYRSVYKYIILTIVALLIGAILGLPKDIVVLWWKKKFIYTPDNNSAKIMVSAYQLCFLLRTDESEMSWILSRPYELQPPDYKHTLPSDFMDKLRAAVLMPGTSSVQDPSTKIDVTRVWSVQDIDEVANWLKKWIDMPEDGIPAPADHHSYVLEHIKDKYSERQDKTGDEVLTEFKCPETQQFLGEMLRLDGMDDDVNASNKEPYAEFENRMIGRYKRSLAFTNKLYEDFKLTGILSVILTVVQVVVAFLVWLFITQLATTKLVVTLGSLFLGLTFVFGDSCKTFFQGCVFSFVTHPLDVGDIVSIDSDSTKLEVKRINVMATMFFQTKNRDNILIYPNSELATKKILKFKGAQESENPKSPPNPVKAKTAIEIKEP